MSKFTYSLPSGAVFTMTAPEGTSQAAADEIFYSQAAAGTFVGYKPGDTLTHPTHSFNNFGISRLQRGTAGVDDKTLLAVISKLPIVAPVPELAHVPVPNPINQTNFIQVNSNPSQGVFATPPTPIGSLSSTQVQALMAQTAAVINQDATSITQESGIGKYGFNAQQLERVGYIKPGYSQRFCPLDVSTQANPDIFVAFMKSPTPWTGLNGVLSVNDILNNEALQNQIQTTLMSQSHDALVSAGLIQAQSTDTTSVNTGQVYTADGTLTKTAPLTLLALAPKSNSSDALVNNNLYSTAASVIGKIKNPIDLEAARLDPYPVGIVPDSIQGLGVNAVASYSSGLNSLSTGAVGFSTNTLNNRAMASGEISPQLSGLATGLAGSTNLTASIASSLNGDIGALVVNASKFGSSVTASWSQNAPALNAIGGEGLAGLGNNLPTQGLRVPGIPGLPSIPGIPAIPGIPGLPKLPGMPNLGTGLSSNLNMFGKSSQFGINFSDFSLSSAVAGVQPAAAFSNTVNRATLDASVTRIIGTNKIAAPTFEPPSPASLGSIADVSQAQSLLAKVNAVAGGGLGSLNVGAVGGLGQVSGLVNSAKNLTSGQPQSALAQLMNTRKF